MRLKRLGARGHTCVFAETHADTHNALRALPPARARNTQTRTSTALERSQREGRRASSSQWDVTWHPEHKGALLAQRTRRQ